jgi:acyl-CoA synthetase (AMP-forming)/AMP-acid ligase II
VTAKPSTPRAAGDRLRSRLAAVLALEPGAPALEFGTRWYTWADVAGAVEAVADAFSTLGLEQGSQVGIILRNRPTSIGLLLGVVQAGGCAVVINPLVGQERAAADISKLDLPLLMGEPADIDTFVPAAQPARSACLSLVDLGTPPTLTQPADLARAGSPALGGRSSPPEPRPEVAIRLLTSGTTGPPKRIDLTHETFERVLRGAKHYEADARDDVRLREGVVIVNSPMVHLGGLFRVLQAVSDGRRVALLERFTVDEWVDRVRRHRPKTASLVPTALRMVLDADLDPADLSSLRSVVSGTAPLAADVAERFTDRYGIPVLTNYAATEFGGAVAGWNLADHQQWWSQKRGSVGRAHPGSELRVVDPEGGDVLETGAVGLLEVRAEQLPGQGWVRTTDLARIDEDGFLWIVGRADQTIIRGGLKVQPEVVQRALERHPGVRAAAVIGVDDERLGQVPVAVVERTNDDAVDEQALLEHASAYLARYEVPVDVVFVEAIPRAVTAKVDLGAVRSLVAAARHAGSS